jgi:DNA-binding PadR family transcriptional regulator
MNDLLNSLVVELRRGTLILIVLAFLSKDQYGYQILEKLKAKDVKVEANTLYPLLRRLESQGLLESRWDTNESHPRKFYSLTEKGKDTLKLLKNEWQEINKEVKKVIGDKHE